MENKVAKVQAKLTKLQTSVSVKGKLGKDDLVVLRDTIALLREMEREEQNDEIIPIDLPVDVIATLAIAAHEEDMTLNDFIVERIGEYCKDIIEECSRRYNPRYGDDKVCTCGHEYYRHFDTYEDMYPCGCKYCACNTFEDNELTNFNATI